MGRSGVLDVTTFETPLKRSTPRAERSFEGGEKGEVGGISCHPEHSEAKIKKLTSRAMWELSADWVASRLAQPQDVRRDEELGLKQQRVCRGLSQKTVG